MSETTNTNEKTKVKYATVGTIKTIDLSNHIFTIEPISAYRFQTKDDDESSWNTIFKEDKETDDVNKNKKDALPRLVLVVHDAKFKVSDKMIDALIALKQNKAKIEVWVDSARAMQGDEFDVLQITVK